MTCTIDVWTVDLTCSVISTCTAILSADELARASRMRREQDRRRWICARAALRSILAIHCECPPADIRVAYGPFGKPKLAARRSRQALHFNLTRSGALCLIAVCTNGPIGIDVEELRPLEDEEQIVAMAFTSKEALSLQELSGAERNRTFFELWTRKEAWVKAMGTGLQHAPRELDVSAVDPCVALIASAGSTSASTWRLKSFSPLEGYVGCVAVGERRGRPWRNVEIRNLAFDHQATARSLQLMGNHSNPDAGFFGEKP